MNAVGVYPNPNPNPNPKLSAAVRITLEPTTRTSVPEVGFTMLDIHGVSTLITYPVCTKCSSRTQSLTLLHSSTTKTWIKLCQTCLLENYTQYDWRLSRHEFSQAAHTPLYFAFTVQEVNQGLPDTLGSTALLLKNNLHSQEWCMEFAQSLAYLTGSELLRQVLVLLTSLVALSEDDLKRNIQNLHLIGSAIPESVTNVLRTDTSSTPQLLAIYKFLLPT